MAEEKAKQSLKSETKIVVIRIRGQTGVKKDISDTLDMLNLKTKFSCVVLSKQDNIDGMIKKVKDFVTFGEVDSDTLNELITKRGVDGKKTFTLHPPRGGFERKGTKKTYVQGGALGNRKEKINELIKKML